MTRFKSVPHSIEAWRFVPDAPKEKPMWLVNAERDGVVMETIAPKWCYVTIYNKAGQSRAHPGDWVCRNDSGNIFVLTNDELGDSFVHDEDSHD